MKFFTFSIEKIISPCAHLVYRNVILTFMRGTEIVSNLHVWLILIMDSFSNNM